MIHECGNDTRRFRLCIFPEQCTALYPRLCFCFVNSNIWQVSACVLPGFMRLMHHETKSVGEAGQRFREEVGLPQHSRSSLVLHRRRRRCSGAVIVAVGGAGHRFREEADVRQYSRSSLVPHKQTAGEMVYQTIRVGEAGQRFQKEAVKPQYFCGFPVLHRRTTLDVSGIMISDCIKAIV